MLNNGRNRVVIENVKPEIDAGRFPIKRAVGEKVVVLADFELAKTLKRVDNPHLCIRSPARKGRIPELGKVRAEKLGLVSGGQFA